jgi:hypothetical protein
MVCHNEDDYDGVRYGGPTPEGVPPIPPIFKRPGYTTDIRCYSPSQLMDDMEGRDDAADYRTTVWTAADCSVTIVHIPTGAFGNCGQHRSVFRNKREAWAVLQEKLTLQQ